MLKKFLIVLLVLTGANAGHSDECIDKADKAAGKVCIDLAPLTVYPARVTQILYDGLVASGTTSWSKVPSVVPEDKTYIFNGHVSTTTEGLFLNKSDMEKYTIPYRDLKPPRESMPLQQTLELESLAPVPTCEKGSFLFVFNSENKVICSELSCGKETELKLKCGFSQ